MSSVSNLHPVITSVISSDRIAAVQLDKSAISYKDYLTLRCHAKEGLLIMILRGALLATPENAEHG